MTATTATTLTQRTTSTIAPRFGATLQAEWTKLRSVRATWIMVALALGLSIGSSALVALVTGSTFASWDTDTQAAFDPLVSSMGGWVFGLIVLTVLGVTSVTSEYSSGLIRTTLIGTPRRTQVLTAKAIVVATLGMAISAIAVAGMVLVSQPIYQHYGLETSGITDSAAIRLLAGAVLVQALIATLIPFSFAWLLRGTASAITLSIGFFFLPWMLGSVAPSGVQQYGLRYLPDMAASSLSGMTASDATLYLEPISAALVTVVWLAGALLAAAVVLNRRDV